MAEVRGLRTIASFIEALSTRARGPYSRGHGSKDWILVPSVFRDETKGIDTKEKLFEWRRSAARFALPQPRTQIEWLVLAQQRYCDPAA